MSFPFHDIIIPGNDRNHLTAELLCSPKKPFMTGVENIESAEYKYSRHERFTVGAL